MSMYCNGLRVLLIPYCTSNHTNRLTMQFHANILAAVSVKKFAAAIVRSAVVKAVIARR